MTAVFVKLYRGPVDLYSNSNWPTISKINFYEFWNCKISLKDQPASDSELCTTPVCFAENENPLVWNVKPRHRTWWIAVIPDIVIRLMSMSTLTLLSILITASPSLSLMLSWKTISSGNRTRLTPGWVLAKKLALLDMFRECQYLMGPIIHLPAWWERLHWSTIK